MERRPKKQKLEKLLGSMYNGYHRRIRDRDSQRLDAVEMKLLLVEILADPFVEAGSPQAFSRG